MLGFRRSSSSLRSMCTRVAALLSPFLVRAITMGIYMQVFTLGGSFSGSKAVDKGGEVWSASTGVWRETSNILGQIILSDDPQGAFRTHNYGFFFAWTNNSGANASCGMPAASQGFVCALSDSAVACTNLSSYCFPMNFRTACTV